MSALIRSAASKVMWVGRARTLALWLLAVLVAASIGLLLGANSAHAADFRVNSMEDAFDNSSTDGECATDPFRPGFEPNCTLRAAIQEANVNGESDTITFNSFLSGTITLTLGELELANDAPANDLIIEGPGARKITVSGNDASRVFMIDFLNEGTEATISGLTISDGEGSPQGGGIFNSGTLTLTDSTVSGNTASFGASSIFGGGGIFNSGTLLLRNSTVSGNTATFYGAGITNRDTLEMSNSTVSGNTITGDSGGGGGGIFNWGVTLTLMNSTVSGNTATDDGLGGGILNDGDSGVLTLSNTIIAGNTATGSPDAKGSFASQGNNLIGDISGSSGWVTSDLLNVNPLLGPLQNNGGPTNTHALLPGSRSVDAGANTTCLPTDQRGVTRKDGDKNGSVICDIGAFERNDLTPPKVKRVVPAESATGIGAGANVSAFFSEAMRAGSINTNTIKLFKAGTTTPLAAVVSYDASTKKATLNPNANLQRGAKYKAAVTTGAKDRAGNRLDQNAALSGLQQKVWFFTVRN